MAFDEYDSPDYQYLMDNDAWSGGSDTGNYLSARSMPGAYTGGPGGVSIAGAGQDWMAPVSNSGGTNWAGMSSGLGSILALAPQLIGMHSERQAQKKILKLQRAVQQKQFEDTLKNYAEGQGDILRAGQFGRPSLEGDLAERGLKDSSIRNTDLGLFDYNQNRRLDELMRRRALDQFGHEAMLKIQKIQDAQARRSYYMQIAAMVGNAIGNAAGAAGGMMSDKDEKENIKGVSTKRELEQVEKTPVKAWNYKKDKVNPRLGPMAQDVKKNMGDETSNGHKIDVVSMLGKQMAAIQQLAKEVKELKKNYGI